MLPRQRIVQHYQILVHSTKYVAEMAMTKQYFNIRFIVRSQENIPYGLKQLTWQPCLQRILSRHSLIHTGKWPILSRYQFMGKDCSWLNLLKIHPIYIVSLREATYFVVYFCSMCVMQKSDFDKFLTEVKFQNIVKLYQILYITVKKGLQNWCAKVQDYKNSRYLHYKANELFKHASV